MIIVFALIEVVAQALWIPVGLILWIPLVTRAAVWSVFLAMASAVTHQPAATAGPVLENALKFWPRGFIAIHESFSSSGPLPPFRSDRATAGLKVALFAIAFWASTLAVVAIAEGGGRFLLSGRAAMPTTTTLTRTLAASETFKLKARTWEFLPFSVPNTGHCRLIGTIEVIAGGSRDAWVSIFNPDQFTAAKDGLSNSQRVYDSKFRESLNLDVPLEPGDYFLVITNIAVFTDKMVKRNAISARCES